MCFDAQIAKSQSQRLQITALLQSRAIRNCRMPAIKPLPKLLRVGRNHWQFARGLDLKSLVLRIPDHASDNPPPLCVPIDRADNLASSLKLNHLYQPRCLCQTAISWHILLRRGSSCTHPCPKSKGRPNSSCYPCSCLWPKGGSDRVGTSSGEDLANVPSKT